MSLATQCMWDKCHRLRPIKLLNKKYNQPTRTLVYNSESTVGTMYYLKYTDFNQQKKISHLQD